MRDCIFFLLFILDFYKLKQWLLLAPSSGWFGDHNEMYTNTSLGRSAVEHLQPTFSVFITRTTLLNYIFLTTGVMLPHWPHQGGHVCNQRDIFWWKVNYSVMLGSEITFSPWNEGLFRNVLVRATQGNNVYCFHPIRQLQCVIKPFLFSPLRLSQRNLPPGRRDNYFPTAWHGPCCVKVARNHYSSWDWNSARAAVNPL